MMSSASSNGTRYQVHDGKLVSDDNSNGFSDSKESKTSYSIDLKTLLAILSMIIAVGTIIWTASNLATSKASASDVVELDKTLVEMGVKLDHIIENMSEIKKDLEKVEDKLNKL